MEMAWDGEDIQNHSTTDWEALEASTTMDGRELTATATWKLCCWHQATAVPPVDNPTETYRGLMDL